MEIFILEIINLEIAILEIAFLEIAILLHLHDLVRLGGLGRVGGRCSYLQ